MSVKSCALNRWKKGETIEATILDDAVALHVYIEFDQALLAITGGKGKTIKAKVLENSPR